ncbi:MAG: glycosyltransferase family 4 protein [Calditrichia bacterium]
MKEQVNQTGRMMRSNNGTITHATISPCDNERRIFNQARSAVRAGWQVQILARKLEGIAAEEIRDGYLIRRIPLRRNSGGPFMFLFFNLKLFWRLQRCKSGIIHAHDLWVLPACGTAVLLSRSKLIYDAHEYYRGLEILRHKPFSRMIWRFAEWLFIRIAAKIVVINGFHKELFRKTYPFINEPAVIMNLPELNSEIGRLTFRQRNAGLLFQGIFKPARGLPQLIRAMQQVEGGILTLVGFGELEKELERLVNGLSLQTKVIFAGKMPVTRLLEKSETARAGLVLFEPAGANYKFASPNKFFEYVMAGTPVVASRIPTFESFLQEFEVGLLVNPDDEAEIAAACRTLLLDEEKWQALHENCLKARQVWNWEKQEQLLLDLYRELNSDRNE